MTMNQTTATCVPNAPASGPASAACVALAEAACQASGWTWNTSLAAFPQGACQVTTGANSGSWYQAITYKANGACFLGGPNAGQLSACVARAQTNCSSPAGAWNPATSTCTLGGVASLVFANLITGQCSLGSTVLQAGTGQVLPCPTGTVRQPNGTCAAPPVTQTTSVSAGTIAAGAGAIGLAAALFYAWKVGVL
jgi:hypothetical protein